MRRFTLAFAAFVLSLGVFAAQPPLKKVYNPRAEKSVALQKRMKASASEDQPEGERRSILSEDFSKMPTGTVDAPSEMVNDATGAIPDEYLQTPGWSATTLRSADGAGYIDLDSNGETGVFFSPIISSMHYGATVTLKAKLVAESGTTDDFYVEYNDADFQVNISYSLTQVNADDWTTIEATFPAFDYGIYMAFYATKYKVLIDDINVETFVPFIVAPVAQPFTNYVGTGFTANWTAVDNAAVYLLSVFHLDANEAQVFDLEDKEVAENSYAVTGLDENQAYYYYVKAKDAAGHVSGESNVVTVKSLVAPVLNDATVSTDGFTASWQAVNGATKYDFWAYRDHTATADETYALLDTDFASVASTGTIDAPEINGALSDYVDALPGWILWGSAFVDGAVGINGDAYDEGMPCYLESPLFDLSVAGGTVTLEGDFAANAQSDLSVMLLNETVANEFETVNQTFIEGLTTGWAHHSVSLSNGAAASELLISPTGVGQVFIDNLKLTISLPSGKRILVPIKNAVTTETSVDVVADLTSADRYAFKVRAIKQTDTEAVTGTFSELRYVEAQDGVAALNGVDARCYMAGGSLHIENPNGEQAAVYNSNGVLLWRSSSRSATVDLPVRGVYLVKVGQAVTKVMR